MTTSFYRKTSSSLWLSGILIFSDRCWADVQEMITGQRKTLFLGEGKLRFFHVHFSVFILSVISWNETAGWLNSPLFGGTIQCFIVSFHGSQGMPGQKWPPLTGDCELASSLPDSEEGGKWQSRILPREQRWLDVRGWFLVDWNQVLLIVLRKIGNWNFFPLWMYFILTGDRVSCSSLDHPGVYTFGGWRAGTESYPGSTELLIIIFMDELWLSSMNYCNSWKRVLNYGLIFLIGRQNVRFGHWQYKCSCHLMNVTSFWTFCQVLCSPYSQFHQPTCFWKWGGEPVYSPYWSGVLRWWQCSSFPALQRTTTPRPFPG